MSLLKYSYKTYSYERTLLRARVQKELLALIKLSIHHIKAMYRIGSLKGKGVF